ncbi:AbrB/MazE/SpoVT family DNA-binding domain-containing protein [Ralstonia pseudosolanacearum]|uniref:AbrB/MazE/SpoVT family DNA-binding domain-containing protein n=1 Tax=Ralstonia pseudosolanacearum TaxID=1310165 RepID=UPI003AAB9922
MKPTFRERQELRNEYAKEVNRMLRCLRDAGTTATDDEAVLAWATYSDDLCAGWLGLPEDDAALREILVKYLPGAKSRVWRVTGVDAGDGSGDFIVPLPSELLAQLGWAIGDELEIERADDGSLVLRRI